MTTNESLTVFETIVPTLKNLETLVLRDVGTKVWFKNKTKTPQFMSCIRTPSSD